MAVREILEIGHPVLAARARDHLAGVLFPHRVTDPGTFCSWSSFAAFRQEAFADRVRQLVDRWGA